MISYVRLGILAGLFISGLLLGWGYEHRNLVAYKAEVETVAREQEAKVISIQKQQELVNKGITNGFQNQLRAVRNYYDGLLNASGSQLPAVSNPTLRANESPAYYELAGACAATTVQTIALQDWIKESAALK